MGNRCNCPQCEPGDQLCPAAEDAERDVAPTEVEYWKPLAMERLHAALQAIDERNEARRELDSYKDGHLCHPRNSLTSDSGGICAHCGRTLLEQPGYEDALTKARAEVKRLTERVHEDNAVCLCGCSVGDHENLGEDGEGCGHDDHQCLRVPVAVAQIVADLRASVRERERAAFEDGARWGQHRVNVEIDMDCEAELDRRYPKESQP